MGFFDFIAQVWAYLLYFFWTQWVDTGGLPPPPAHQEFSSDLVSSFDSTGYDADSDSESVSVATVPRGSLEVETGNTATQPPPPPWTTQGSNCDWGRFEVTMRVVLSIVAAVIVGVQVYTTLKDKLKLPFEHMEETKGFKIENPAMDVFRLSPNGNLTTHFSYVISGPQSYYLSTIIAGDGLFLSEERVLTYPVERSVGLFAWKADIEQYVVLSAVQLKSLLIQIRRGILELDIQVLVNKSRIIACPLQVTLPDKVIKTLPCH